MHTEKSRYLISSGALRPCPPCAVHAVPLGYTGSSRARVPSGSTLRSAPELSSLSSCYFGANHIGIEVVPELYHVLGLVPETAARIALKSRSWVITTAARPSLNNTSSDRGVHGRFPLSGLSPPDLEFTIMEVETLLRRTLITFAVALAIADTLGGGGLWACALRCESGSTHRYRVL